MKGDLLLGSTSFCLSKQMKFSVCPARNFQDILPA